ncbi:MAG: hypothetical protein K1X42_14195 [Opitutaceae bacterium]|nr:hypothetical protein [Opitutaceae bacterium]
MTHTALDRHLFITVEGLSGSGKTTVATQLATQLRGRYYKTPPELFTPIREAIDRNANAFSRHLYYYAGVAQASAEIEPLLQYCPVVCDKYLATMLAYSRAQGISVEMPSVDLVVRPDFAFLLDANDALRRQRVEKRGRITHSHDAFLRMEIDRGVMTQFRKLDLPTIDNNGEGIAAAVQSITSWMTTHSNPTVWAR